MVEHDNIVEEHLVPYDAITSLEQLGLPKRYSFADYFRWKFQQRVELFRGWIHKMRMAPTPKHQLFLGNLFLQFKSFCKYKPCKVFSAPFGLRLPDSKKQTGDEWVFTVVQPDLGIICDPDKIDSPRCFGAPDLIIEILSPAFEI